jgi:Flp pilus assembly secretin CpaC
MRLSCVRLLACGLATALVTVLGASNAVQSAEIDVILDRARLVKLPDRVATLVIGNPAIADATIQSGGWMVITGKGYGATNIIALDRAGAILMERTVEVLGPQEAVVVYRGVERDTLNCTPECERRLTLGDAPIHFDTMATQIGTRNGLAAGTAASR